MLIPLQSDLKKTVPIIAHNRPSIDSIRSIECRDSTTAHSGPSVGLA